MLNDNLCPYAHTLPHQVCLCWKNKNACKSWWFLLKHCRLIWKFDQVLSEQSHIVYSLIFLFQQVWHWCTLCHWKINFFGLFWYGYRLASWFRIGFIVVFRTKIPISGPNIAFYAAMSFLEKRQLGYLFSFQIFMNYCVSSRTIALWILRAKIALE